MMPRCPRCRRGAVLVDSDDRSVCLSCGEVVFDELSLLEQVAHNVSLSIPRGDPDVAERAGGLRTATRHHAAEAAWDADDGYRYGDHGERSTRRLIGSADQ